MPTLFLSFANNAQRPLDSLRGEDAKVNSALNGRKLRGDFIVHSEQYATTDKIISGLRQFKDDIILFLYSGHAGKNSLELEDREANANGIASLLGRCPNLQLVILNGCSTAGQVQNLLAQGIPLVIATSALVDDRRATQFSITFFEELALKRQPIKTAFKEAINAAKVYGQIRAIVKSRGSALIEEIDASLWGLYHQDDKADVAEHWRLPEKPITTQTNQYLNNAIDGIFEKYEQILVVQDESSRRQDFILKRLPYSISEPIRKLLAPSDQSGQLFYDRPSKERFEMLLYAYRSIIGFINYVLLAQLWELKRLPNNILNVGTFRHWFKNRLNKNSTSVPQKSDLVLLKQLIAFFEHQEIQYFLEELKEAQKILGDSETNDAIAFLEKKILDNPQNNLEYLCEETEQNLAIVLYQFGFLIHYSLTSVKDINVLFYPHYSKPDFEHKIVKLQQALTQLEDRTKIEKDYHKTATVLLRRIDNKSKFLYLSPFFIDENAYTKSPKAKLCSFIGYNVQQRQYYFYHVSKPKELIKIEEKKVSALAKVRGDTKQNDNFFPLINGQFSAFCKDMFGKTLEEL